MDSLSIELSRALYIQTPVCGLVVANKRYLYQAVDPEEVAPCLKDCITLTYDPFRYSYELTRPARANCIWFAVRFSGMRYIREVLLKNTLCSSRGTLKS